MMCLGAWVFLSFAQAHLKKQNLRDGITQATTQAELNAIKWGD